MFDPSVNSANVNVHIHCYMLVCQVFDMAANKFTSYSNESSKIELTNMLQPTADLELQTLTSSLIVLAGDIKENPGPTNESTKEKCLSILHQNIRSIRNKFEYCVLHPLY